MPWVAPIIGYSDNLGRLRCSDCAQDHQREHAVSGDGYFGSDDICECCGWQFTHIKSSDYVQVSFGYPTPDIRKPKRAA
jgi:hypothetical protein